jgi:hypothetical protein
MRPRYNSLVIALALSARVRLQYARDDYACATISPTFVLFLQRQPELCHV